MSETLLPESSMTTGQSGQSAQHRSDLRRWNAPIQAELAEVFVEPLQTLTERLEMTIDACINDKDIADTGINTGAVKSLMDWHPTDIIPYSVASLPPNLFDHCRWSNRPFIPTDDYELQKFMESFWPDHLRYGPRFASLHHPTEPEFMHNLENELRRRRGQQIDQEDWYTYQRAREEQERRGYTNLGHNASRVLDSRQFPEDRGIFELATGQCKQFVLMDTSSLHRLTSPVRTPIGDYGLNLAIKLSRTTGFIIDFIESDPDTRRIMYERAVAHPEVLEKHTLRGQDKRMPGEDHGSLITLEEGVASCHGQLTSLTTQAVEGFASWQGDELVKKVIDERLISKATRLSSVGTVASHSLYGTYIPDMLEHIENDRYMVPRHTREAMAALCGHNIDTYHYPLWADHHKVALDGLAGGVKPPTRLGLPCFTAMPIRRSRQCEPEDITTPLDTFMRAFYKVFNYICELDHESIRHATPSTNLPWNIPILDLRYEGPPSGRRNREYRKTSDQG